MGTKEELKPLLRERAQTNRSGEGFPSAFSGQSRGSANMMVKLDPDIKTGGQEKGVGKLSDENNS